MFYLNNLKDNALSYIEADTQSIADLIEISNVPLCELTKNNPGLFVFPNLLENSKDLYPESSILSLIGTSLIQTGNIVGYLSTGETQIAIKSRFAKNNSDFLLRYLIEKTLNINLMDFNLNSSEEPLYDFLRILFPQFLKNALKQGIYKEYMTIKHNDSKFKGTLDVTTHLKENIPFRGSFAYSTRERVIDNNVTQLIRHTIEFIKEENPLMLYSMKADFNTNNCFNVIINSTPSYVRSKRSFILHKCNRMKISPYYSLYLPLIKLCQAILRLKKLSYGDQERNIHGILFDISWMWESYIWSLLKKEGFIHPDNRNDTGSLFFLIATNGKAI